MLSSWREQWIKLLALLMAVFLWLYVANEQNPVVDMGFNGIDLVVQNQPTDFVCQGVPETVNIRVQGNRNVVGMLQRRDFTAYLTMPEQITPGSLKLPIQVLPPPGVEVVKITPRQVQVHVDRITSKNIPVVAKLQGTPVAGLTLGTVDINPSHVLAQGPSLVLAKINEIKVAVDVTGATATLVKEMSLAVGQKGVTLRPGRVTVTVPMEDLPVQNIPVRVNLTGTPADGFQVSQVLVNPETVQVQGTPGQLAELTVINTAAVDITGVAENIERTLKLELPQGINFIEPKQVQVQIQLLPPEQAKPGPTTPPDSEDDHSDAEG